MLLSVLIASGGSAAVGRAGVGGTGTVHECAAAGPVCGLGQRHQRGYGSVSHAGCACWDPAMRLACVGLRDAHMCCTRARTFILGVAQVSCIFMNVCVRAGHTSSDPRMYIIKCSACWQHSRPCNILRLVISFIEACHKGVLMNARPWRTSTAAAPSHACETMQCI